MAKDMTHQRSDAISNAHVGRAFEDTVQQFFVRQGIQLDRQYKVLIGVAEIKKLKQYDLGCGDHKIIVECKSSRWTKSGNAPTAKIKDWNSEMLHFLLAPKGYRKLMFVTRSVRMHDSQTLAQYYIRLHGHLVPSDVEFWEYDERTNEAICLRSGNH